LRGIQLAGIAAVEFRKKPDRELWHFCRNCSQWPVESYNVMILEGPGPDFEICKDCLALKQKSWVQSQET